MICHCRTEAEANVLRTSVDRRLVECRLELNQQKTKIVYCKMTRRPGTHPTQSFDFLGYTFRPREARSRWGTFLALTPGVSRQAVVDMQREVRRWRVPKRSTSTLEDLAQWMNPIVHGWINYYARFHRTALYPFLYHLNLVLMRWALRRYRRFKSSKRRAFRWLARIARTERGLFAHWKLVPPTAR